MNIDDLIRNTKPTPEDWFLTKTVEGGVEITGLSEKAQLNGDGALDLVLPSTIRGTKVVAVADKAFLNCEPLRSVVVPEGVETIGAYAFCYCQKLRNVVLPESVKSIGSVAFYDCVALEGFFIPANVETIGSCAFAKSSGFIEVAPNNRNYSSEEGVLFDKKKEVLLHVPIFPFSTALEQSEFTKLLESAVETGVLPTWVFTDYRIPHTVKKIDDCTFLNSRDVKRVFIHKGVEKIGDLAFAGSGIQVKVDPQSAKYSSEAGILFDKARATLLHFPGDKAVQSYAIPNTIKTIDFGAFYNCSSLEEIDIPESVERISAWAFFACSSLKEIVLPNTVKEYGDWAFAWCKELKSATIPDGVQTIGKHAFYECPSLSEPVMPKSVKRQTIVGFAFLTRHSLLPPVTPDSLSVIISEPFIDDSKRKVFDYEMPNSEGKTVKCQFEVEDVDEHDSDWWYANRWDEDEEEANEGNYSEKIEGWVVTGFSAEERLDKIVVPTTIDGKNVLAIGDKSFYSTDATSVVFPEGVEVVGHRVFRYCPYLTDVVIPKSVRYICDEFFYDCAPILHVHDGSYAKAWARRNNKQYEIIPRRDGLGKYPDDWFSYEEVDGGVTITDFNDDAVKDGEIILPSTIDGKKVVALAEELFSGSSIKSVVLPNGIETIPDCAFYRCYDLEKVVVPDSVKTIGYGAFCRCVKLTNVILPEGVKSIAEEAFAGCQSLTKIVIPESVEVIGRKAFGISHGAEIRKHIDFEVLSTNAIIDVHPNNRNYCSDDGVLFTKNKDVLLRFSERPIQSYIVPDSVEYIAEGAFFGCSSLKTVVIPNSVTHIDEDAFGKCASLETMIIPESVKVIRQCAFQGCSMLRSIILPEKLRYLGEKAFEQCKSLKELVIPNGVARIEDETFQSCYSLVKITIPESVKGIGCCAFEGCASLTKVSIPETVEEIEYTAFRNCRSLKDLFLPENVKVYSRFARTQYGTDGFCDRNALEGYCEPKANDA